MQKLHWYMQHIYSILFAEEEGGEKNTCTALWVIVHPIFVLLTINHYQ